MRVNLGCGSDYREGWIGVDRVKIPGVDIVHDLDTGPWPFHDDSVEEILARDVFEHVADPVMFMTECWRILQPMGLLHIKTPHWKHRDAYTDPTHKRFPTEHSFDYWLPGTILHSLHGKAYGDVNFGQDSMHITVGAIHLKLIKPTPEVDLEYREAAMDFNAP